MCHSYVYMVRCSDGSLYTGISTDMEREVRRLNEGEGSSYVRARLPVFLAYTEEYMNERDATRRAASLKRLRRDEKERLLVGPSAAPSELGFAV